MSVLLTRLTIQERDTSMANSANQSCMSKYVTVLGSKIHYLEQGEGDTILFLHGIPTSSYLWRNVIPPIAKQGRCIALDLIGMGKSDKPNIPYRVFDYIRYVEGFIEALQLEKITFVLHEWGSVIGFDYAMRHESNVKALIFYESHLRPITTWEMLALPVQELTSMLNAIDRSTDLILNSNYYMEKIFPAGMLRKLTKDEADEYSKPFQTPQDRRLLLQYLNDFPIGKKSTDVNTLIADYSDKLKKSRIPKLMLYTIPGFNTTVDTLVWAKENLKNVFLADVGEDLHYAQESNPELMSDKIIRWLKALKSVSNPAEIKSFC